MSKNHLCCLYIMFRNKNNEAGSSIDNIITLSSPATNHFSVPSTSTSDQSLQ